MNKAVLFNGARVCGKDSAISYLIKQGVPLVRRECKDHLHKLTQLFFCVPEERYWEIYNDRSLKEVPLPEFNLCMGIEEEFHIYYDCEDFHDFRTAMKWRDEDCHIFLDRLDEDYCTNLSIREAVIYFSEVVCKPRFGQDYFGAARAKSIKDGEIVVDGSCGFKEELPPLIDRIGMENILLLRIHREGCTFEGDSRDFIPNGVITNTVDIYNNGTEDEYLQEVHSKVKEFLNDY